MTVTVRASKTETLQNGDLPPAVILAGGRSRRMDGADKAFSVLGGESLLARTITRIRPQVSSLVISANDESRRFSQWNIPTVADAEGPDLGPLAGILAGMQWLKEKIPQAEHIISVPVDTPFLPENFVRRLLEENNKTLADIVIAVSSGRSHFVSALWSLSLAHHLHEFLVGDGPRKVETFVRQQSTAEVKFSDKGIDPFFNANTPEDLAVAEEMLIAMSEDRS